MPSVSLQSWRTDRMLSLQEIETQCAASLVVVPPNPRLSEENLRGSIVLLERPFPGILSRPLRGMRPGCRRDLAARIAGHDPDAIHGEPRPRSRQPEPGQYPSGFRQIRSAARPAGGRSGEPGSPPGSRTIERMEERRGASWRRPAGRPPFAGRPASLAGFLRRTGDVPGRNPVQSAIGRPWDRAVGSLAEKERVMATTANVESRPFLKVGDRVMIRHASGLQGRVVEFADPSVPAGRWCTASKSGGSRSLLTSRCARTSSNSHRATADSHRADRSIPSSRIPSRRPCLRPTTSEGRTAIVPRRLSDRHRPARSGSDPARRPPFRSRPPGRCRAGRRPVFRRATRTVHPIDRTGRD